MPKFENGKQDLPVDVIQTITGKLGKTTDPKNKTGPADEESRQALGATSRFYRDSIFGARKNEKQ